MKKNLVLLAALMLVVISGCAKPKALLDSDWHRPGRVVSVSENTAMVCLPKDEPIKIGDVFDVYKITRVRLEPRSPLEDKLVYTGKIEITQLSEEHYGLGKIISGTVRKGYTIKD